MPPAPSRSIGLSKARLSVYLRDATGGWTLTMAVHFQLDVQAQQGATSTDFFNTARLSLMLPADANYSTSADVPLAWITVAPGPETHFLMRAFLGIVGMATWRGSHRQHRGLLSRVVG